MFVMVLVTCITLESQTVCHEFPRGHQFSSLSSCKTASAIDRGRYRSRIAERKWANYDWNCIARALITKPKLLLLDEPTEGIQPNIITQIGEVISFLRNQKTMAIVLVEQYFDFAFGLADQIYAVKRGEVVYESKKSTIDKSKLRTSVGV